MEELETQEEEVGHLRWEYLWKEQKVWKNIPDMNNPKKTIKAFNHIKRIRKYGCLMAVPMDDGTVAIGWSLCCKKDQFYREIAIEIAAERALAWQEKEITDRKSPVELARMVPQSIQEKLYIFVRRMKRYYKDSIFPEWVEWLECSDEARRRTAVRLVSVTGDEVCEASS